MEKIPLAPPSQKQIAAFKTALDNCQHVETAAALAGVPTTLLIQWITKGRQGVPGFREFVDMIDYANAELAERLLFPIRYAALTKGDLKAAQFLYKLRCAPSELRRQERLEKIREKAEDAFIAAQEAPIAEEDAAAAEARILAAEHDARH